MKVIQKELNTELFWGQYYNKLSNEIRELFKDKYKSGVKKYGQDFDYDKVELEYNNQKIDMESEYSLMVTDEFGYKNYWKVLKYCLDNNIKSICDIGIASGWQSDMFLKNGIEYIGVDISGGNSRVRNNQHSNVSYYSGFYPDVDIKRNANVLGVAILSLGWGTYVGSDGDLIQRQFNKLSEDFNTSIVYVPYDVVEEIKHLFKSVERIEGKLYLLKS